MDSTCKTCAHWRTPAEAKYGDCVADRICNPDDPDTGDAMALPFEVRVCKHPAQTFSERPVEANGFGVIDGSEYYARLITAEDFGCNRYCAAA